MKMKEAPPSSPSPSPERLKSIRGVEELYFVVNQMFHRLFTHPKTGITLFIIFWLDFFNHISATFVLQKKKIGDPLTYSDILIFLVSGTFESVTPYSRMLVVYFGSSLSLGIILMFFLSTNFSLKYISFNVRIICRSFFVVFTLYCTFIINAFINSYSLAGIKAYTIPLTVAGVLHVLILIIFFIFCIISSKSYMQIIHPLICNCPRHALVFYFYVVGSLHTSSYVLDGSTICLSISLGISIFTSFYLLIFPIYGYRLQNVVSLTIVLYNAFANAFMLTIPQFRIYGLYLIIPAFFISLIHTFVIYPTIIYKIFKTNRFQIAYIIGYKKKIFKELNNFTYKVMKQTSPSKLRYILTAAVYYDHPRLQIISKIILQANSADLSDNFIIWVAYELLNTHAGKLPDQEKQLLQNLYDDVEKHEKQLWKCAWLNYYVILPKITAQIGHAKALYNSVYDLFKIHYPEIEDFGHPKFDNGNHSKGIRRTFRIFNFYVFILIILFGFLHLNYLKAVLNETHHLNDTLNIQYLAESVTSYQILSSKNMKQNFDLEKVKQQYNSLETVSQHSQSVFQFINQSNLKSSFSSMNFDEIFNGLNNSLYNYADICYKETFSQSKSLILNSIELNGLIFVILVLLIVGIFAFFRVQLVTNFKKFYSVPNEIYLKLGDVKPKYDIKYSIPYRPSIFDSFTFIASFVYIGSFIFILLVCTCNAVIDRNLISRDISDHYEYIRGITSIERILLHISKGLETMNDTYFYEADDQYCEIHHHKIYKNYVKQIPNDFLQLMGNYFLSSKKSLNMTGFSNLVMKTMENMHNSTNELRAWRFFYIGRFIIFVLNVVLIVSVINVLTWISKPFVLFEMTEIRNILEQVSKYCEIESLGQKLSYKDVQQNWLFAECDLPMITVNKDGIVIFQSSIVSPLLQIPNGIHIMDSKLPKEMINEVLKRIEIYKKEYNPKSEDLFTAMQMHFVVCPHYKFNGQKLELSYLALINVQSHINEKKEIKKKIDQLALCSYPSFIKSYATYTVPGRFTNVGIIKIQEFNNPDIDLNKLASMRMMVTDKLCKLMNINMNYCRLREEGSLIITTVNRNSEATPWNMHTLGAEFLRKLREMIAKVGEMYNIELKPVVLLYRCHDAPLFVSQEHLAMTSFDMGFEYSALERIDKCVTTSVNYTAEKTESKPQSVTKVRSCVTPRGENFDILVIV